MAEAEERPLITVGAAVVAATTVEAAEAEAEADMPLPEAVMAAIAN